jgi:hypothetical protein
MSQIERVNLPEELEDATAARVDETNGQGVTPAVTQKSQSITLEARQR